MMVGQTLKKKRSLIRRIAMRRVTNLYAFVGGILLLMSGAMVLRGGIGMRIGLGVSVVGLLVFVWGIAFAKDNAHRGRYVVAEAHDRSVMQNVKLGLAIMTCGFGAWYMTGAMNVMVYLAGGFGGCYLLVGFALYLRGPREKQYLWAYREDPLHCGKCGYDALHVSENQCPECGWYYPPGNLLVETRWVWWWWKNWRIIYLEQPKRNLVMLSLLGLVLNAVVMTAVVIMLTRQFDVYALVSLIVVLTVSWFWLHTNINLVRVVQYLWS
ncbi:hypothetical protein JD969_06430 [Planctomycetota bacterium]|nr:hypothetical protein JD969_06430 [Planctomycetota bacterium]